MASTPTDADFDSWEDVVHPQDTGLPSWATPQEVEQDWGDAKAFTPEPGFLDKINRLKAKYVDPVTETALSPVAKGLQVLARPGTPDLQHMGMDPEELPGGQLSEEQRAEFGKKAAPALVAGMAGLAAPSGIAAASSAAGRISLPILRAFAQVAAPAAVGAAEGGAFQVGANALTPGAKIEEGVETATKLGGLLGGTAGLLQSTARLPVNKAPGPKVRNLGLLGLDNVRALGDELDNAASAAASATIEGQVARPLGAPKALPAGPQFVEPYSPGFTPGLTRFKVDEQGNVVARVFEAGADGNARWTEVTLDTPAARAKFARNYGDVAFDGLDGDVLAATNSWGPGERFEVLTGRVASKEAPRRVLRDEPPVPDSGGYFEVVEPQAPAQKQGFTGSDTYPSPQTAKIRIAKEQAPSEAAAIIKEYGLQSGMGPLNDVAHIDDLVPRKPPRIPDASELPTERMRGQDLLKIRGGGGGGGPAAAAPPPKPPDTDEFPIIEVDDLVPPAPPAPQGPPPKPPPHELADIDSIRRGVEAIVKSGDKSLVTRFLDGILADHQRGPKLVQQWIAAMNGARALGDPQANLQAARLVLPKKSLFDAAADALDQAAAGKMSWEEFGRKHPQIAQEAIDMHRDMMLDIQEGEKKLEAMGFIPEGRSALRDRGAMEQYRAQVYYRHFLGRGQWAKAIPRDTLEDGIKFLIKENPTASESDIRAAVVDIIGANDPAEAFAASGLGGGRAASLLKKRDLTLPKPIRDLLGEITSGPVRIAITHAKQQSLLHQAYIWREVVQSPYASPVQSATHPIEIPNDRALYGPAAGMFVTRELEPLKHMPKAAQAAPGFMRALGLNVGSWVKGNQVVLSPHAWVNNAMRNFKGSVLAGGLVPWKPREFAVQMKNAMQVMQAYRRNPSSRGMGALLLEAKRVGAVPMGFGRAEAGGSDAGQKFLEELTEHLGTRDNIFDAMDKIRQKVELLRLPVRKLAPYYDAIDTWFKLGNYMALRQRGLAKALKDGVLKPNEMILSKTGKIIGTTNRAVGEQIARDAAHKINLSFPNFEHPVKPAARMRQTPFGAVSSYLTSALEEMRVNAMLMAQRLNPKSADFEPDLMGRVVASSAMVAGVGGLIWGLRCANGISDEEVAEDRKAMSKASQVYRPGEIALPVRDDKGRVQFFDLGSWAPEMQLAQGHPDDPLGSRLAYNAVTTLTGLKDSWAEDAVVRPFTEWAGLTTPLPMGPQRPKFGEEGTMKAMTDYFSKMSGVVPGVVANYARQAAHLPGNVSPFQEPLTTGQFVANQVLPTTRAVTTPSSLERPGQSPTYRARLYETKRKIEELKKEAYSIGVDKRRSKEERHDLLHGINDEIRRLQAELRDVKTTIQENKR